MIVLFIMKKIWTVGSLVFLDGSNFEKQREECSLCNAKINYL